MLTISFVYLFKKNTSFHLFILKIFFYVGHVFKVFIECVTILLLLQYCFFGHETCEILVPRPGIEPTPPALKGQVLTTRSP